MFSGEARKQLVLAADAEAEKARRAHELQARRAASVCGIHLVRVRVRGRGRVRVRVRVSYLVG